MPTFTGSSANQPIIEFRDVSTPHNVLASLGLVGTGYGNAIVLGGSSSVATFRIYNNFSNVASIHDAVNCVLACYDDATNWSSATTVPVTGLWLSLKVTDYNGTTTDADATFFPVGGMTKHAVPVNGGAIGGASPNYITVATQVAVPSDASVTSVNQGIWLEYNWT